ncbi:MAG: hypothetical protein AAF810_24300 [Cyanobacteria bacterium P01_D01_bin.36]
MDPLLELIRTVAQVIGVFKKPDNNTDNKQKESGNTYIENQYNYYTSESPKDESPKESTHREPHSENSSSKPQHLFVRHPVIGIFLICISSWIVLRSLSEECVYVLEARTNLSSSPSLRQPTLEFNGTEWDLENRQEYERKVQRHNQWETEFLEQNSDALRRDSRDIDRYCTLDATKRNGPIAIPAVILLFWGLGKILTNKGW